MIIFIIVLFISLYINSTCVEGANLIQNDKNPPIIENSIPKKYEQYIVSTPNIKINYKDESQVDKNSIKLFINYKDVTKECEITNDYITYTPNEKFTRGNQIVKIILSDINKNQATYEWYFTVGIPIFNHYYGLLHSHTKESDGHGTYEDAYHFARDKANLDFFAITDHSNYFDNNLNASLDNASNSKKWTSLLECKNWFSSNEKFIPIAGFEITYPHNVDNPIGHINIFNSKGFVSSNNPHLTLEKFYELIYEHDYVVGQFNHPCEKFGDFYNLKYSPLADEVISLIEVYNGYFKDIKKNINSLDMYQKALDLGWHLAPTANQDNHLIDFGVANEFRTVILSTSLTENSIYDALKKMRVYATNDKNIKIDYFINNLPMGSTIKNTSKLNFYISVIDNDENDKIKKIEIISNDNKIIKSKNFNSNIAKLEFSIKSDTNRFYYVKVTQNNNKVSVSAPIWIK